MDNYFKCGNCEYKEEQADEYPCSECLVLKNGEKSNFTPIKEGD